MSSIAPGAEILVGGGYAQFLHGQVIEIHDRYSEPFVTFIERRSRGRLAKTFRHMVPARFCAVFDPPLPCAKAR